MRWRVDCSRSPTPRVSRFSRCTARGVFAAAATSVKTRLPRSETRGCSRSSKECRTARRGSCAWPRSRRRTGTSSSSTAKSAGRSPKSRAATAASATTRSSSSPATAARWRSSRRTRNTTSRIAGSRERSCARALPAARRDERCESAAPRRVPRADARALWCGARRTGRARWAYWGFLLAPDVFGLLPATLLGRAHARGYLPPRGVWLYNAWHTFTVPILVGVVALLLLPIGSPWPVLGWLTHISIDRLLGFGLRGDDGGQAVF